MKNKINIRKISQYFISKLVLYTSFTGLYVYIKKKAAMFFNVCKFEILTFSNTHIEV